MPKIVLQACTHTHIRTFIRYNVYIYTKKMGERERVEKKNLTVNNEIGCICLANVQRFIIRVQFVHYSVQQLKHDRASQFNFFRSFCLRLSFWWETLVSRNSCLYASLFILLNSSSRARTTPSPDPGEFTQKRKENNNNNRIHLIHIVWFEGRRSFNQKSCACRNAHIFLCDGLSFDFGYCC